MAGGYKLFSTGEVLTAANVNNYLMNQTVMVFASAAARTTALSGVLAEGMVSYRTDSHVFEIYNGTSWVSDPSALPLSTVTTKGDIIAATGSGAVSRLAVGSDGSTLVANSAASMGVSWAGQPYANPVLNSAFQVWQRGTSFAIAANVSTAYTADRWQGYRFTTGSTISRQVTGDTTNLPNIQYCARVQRNSGDTNTGQIWLSNNFETINTIPYVGKIITLSYYARAGANYSSPSNTLSVLLFTGTGTDENIVSGYTGSAATLNDSSTLTSIWQRFSKTVTIPTTTTEMSVQFRYTSPTGTAGANDYFEITGVQIDLGSVALPFRTYAGTIAGELAACQRYYWRNTATGNPYGSLVGGMGMAYATGTIMLNVQHPVQMRTTPSSTIDYGGTPTAYNGTDAVTGVSLTYNTGTPLASSIVISKSASFTQYRPYGLTAWNDATTYFGLTAEL